MRIPFIAGNWKMYKTVAETVAFIRELRGLVKDGAGVEIVLAPPFTAVHAAAGDLDPGLVVTACPLVRHGDRTTWAGLPAVAAAVDLRLRALRRPGPAG